MIDSELEHFKEDCKVLFEGPLADMKDKPWSGLIINWLGRDKAQVLKSMDIEANNPTEVYETLEKVFRPESNQNLTCFKLRNMKQKLGQSCDGYMSQLHLALPECKYLHVSDELLKDQLFLVYVIMKSKTICLVNSQKRKIVSMHSMKLVESNLN